MTVLPEPTPTATAAGQATNPLTDAVIQAAVDNAIQQARLQDASPKAVIGNTPPVAQPDGRPPMSQKAVDISTMVLSASVATIPPGAIAIGVMLASGYADPAVIGMICAAPAALAVPILAVARVLRRAKDAAPDVHHHHYEGPVYQDQRTQHSSTRGVWAKTTNQQ